MEQRLSMISLGVADLERARGFYEKSLGWQVAPGSNEDIVFFQMGGMVLGLYSRSALAEDACIADDGAGGFGGFTLAYNVRSREDVAKQLAAAEAAGAKILKPAQDVFWGGHSGYFADLDGHPWEVAFNPYWTIAEDGSIQL